MRVLFLNLVRFLLLDNVQASNGTAFQQLINQLNGMVLHTEKRRPFLRTMQSRIRAVVSEKLIEIFDRKLVNSDQTTDDATNYSSVRRRLTTESDGLRYCFLEKSLQI